MLLAANADIHAKEKVSRILSVYMCSKLCWCFWMMVCCCVCELFINIMFLFYSPFFFSFPFLFFYRTVRLPSIVLLGMVKRVWWRCCWLTMLTSMPKIMLVGYYVNMCPKLGWCFWMIFCCCVWELFINIIFFILFPPFFFLFLFFFFFYRMVRLPSIMLLGMVKRKWLKCC